MADACRRCEKRAAREKAETPFPGRSLLRLRLCGPFLGQPARPLDQNGGQIPLDLLRGLALFKDRAHGVGAALAAGRAACTAEPAACQADVRLARLAGAIDHAPITATVKGTRMSASSLSTRRAMAATSMPVRPQVGQLTTLT